MLKDLANSGVLTTRRCGERALLDIISRLLAAERGARFYKCAFQVNPYDYVRQHVPASRYTNETEYNEAIVAALVAAGIEVIAVTDHHNIRSASTLIAAAEAAGIATFPGFELESKEGIHFLAIFERGTPENEVDRILGDCGIHKGDDRCKYSADGLLENQKQWGCIFIAAHAVSAKGLLKVLSGKARAHLWKDENLLAAAIAGPVSSVGVDCRRILENTEPAYKRERPVAIVNSNDLSAPEDASADDVACGIKMTSPSIEAIRQAFLDPSSRIRLSSDQLPEARSEIIGISWEGGFLGGTELRFNDSLNVLIGGKGTGKSSVLESIRYALNVAPMSDDAKESHERHIREVIKPGTKIALVVKSHRPSEQYFLIERTVPNKPVVRDSDGNTVALDPSGLLRNIVLLSQHEIGDLSRNNSRLTELLRQYSRTTDRRDEQEQGLLLDLERNRNELIGKIKESDNLQERLSALPGIEATLERYKSVGLEERLKRKTDLIREEVVINQLQSRIEKAQEVFEGFTGLLPIETHNPTEVESLPNPDLVMQLDEVVIRLSESLKKSVGQVEASFTRTMADFAKVRAQWEARRNEVERDYEQILRSLQKTSIDAEEFVRLRGRREQLLPLQRQLADVRKKILSIEKKRRELVSKVEEEQRQQFKTLEATAKSVSKQLDPVVRITVQYNAERSDFKDELIGLSGRFSKEWIDDLLSRPDLSIGDFVTLLRSKPDDLGTRYGVPPKMSAMLEKKPLEAILKLEEITFGHKTIIELNVGTEDRPEWRGLASLSAGQRATALLMILLLRSDAPLIIDQPEDDLDNRFISDSIVPEIRKSKRARQFIFATHNANMPVLGDAELIVGLLADGDASSGRAEAPRDLQGAIDAEPVRLLVEELLEGGKIAFETRKMKYGF